MSIASRSNLAILALGASLMTLGGCASSAPTAASADSLQGTVSRDGGEAQAAARSEPYQIASPPGP